MMVTCLSCFLVPCPIPNGDVLLLRFFGAADGLESARSCALGKSAF